MSRRIRSKRSEARFSPASPSRSVTISWPSVSSADSKSSTFIGSSSTRRMRKLPPRLRPLPVRISLCDPTQPALEADAVDRLRQVVVGTECQSRCWLRFDRHDDHRNVGKRGIRFEAAEKVLTPAIRKAQIEHDAERTSAQERLLGAGESAHDLGA